MFLYHHRCFCSSLNVLVVSWKQTCFYVPVWFGCIMETNMFLCSGLFWLSHENKRCFYVPVCFGCLMETCFYGSLTSSVLAEQMFPFEHQGTISYEKSKEVHYEVCSVWKLSRMLMLTIYWHSEICLDVSQNWLWKNLKNDIWCKNLLINQIYHYFLNFHIFMTHFGGM